MMSELDMVSTLLDWCDDNGIWINRGLSVVEDVENGGLRVCNNSGSRIDAHQTLVTIPKTAVLSVRSCSFADAIPIIPYGHGARLGLSLAVYGELLLGRYSRWFGYLQSLPRTTVGIALLWGTEEAWTGRIQGQEVTSDARQAAALAAGTEIERELLGEDGGNIIDEVRQYYTAVVVPAISNPSLARKFPSQSAPSFSRFLHAYSLVNSRAFLVDAYHSLAMVPIADAFNHTQDNHVHLESEFDVCATCGSLAQCAHDTEDDATAISDDAHAPRSAHDPHKHTRSRDAEPESTSAPPHDATPDTCDMVANAPVPPRREVFNTYGAHLANAQLLARYGFALDGNDNDVIVFGIGDLPALVDVAPTRLAVDLLGLYRRVLLEVSLGREWESSSLVYQPAGSAISVTDGGQMHEAAGLCVNSDGRVSHALWVFCAVLAVVASPDEIYRAPEDAHAVAAAVRRLAAKQGLLEGRAGELEPDADDDEGDGDLPRHEGTERADKDTHILATLARAVTWCCTRSPRATRLGRPDPAAPAALSTAALGALLDTLITYAQELPRAHTKTRHAVAQVLAEKSLLQACAASWDDFRAALGPSEVAVRGGLGGLAGYGSDDEDGWC